MWVELVGCELTLFDILQLYMNSKKTPGSVALAGSSWIADNARSLHKDEFFGIDQRPHDVFVHQPLVARVVVDLAQGELQLLFGRPAGESPQEQFLDFLRVGSRILHELIGPAAGS